MQRRSYFLSILALFGLTFFTFEFFDEKKPLVTPVFTQGTPTPEAQVEFDQKAAIARLREQIKGREGEPADKVFKNIQTQFIKSINAGRMLSVMEIAYARSLGVTCTHCHVPDKWESEERPQKQIAREMAAMMARINGELLKGIKNLKSATPTINCTTCHRGEVKPALNLAMPK